MLVKSIPQCKLGRSKVQHDSGRARLTQWDMVTSAQTM